LFNRIDFLHETLFRQVLPLSLFNNINQSPQSTPTVHNLRPSIMKFAAVHM